MTYNHVILVYPSIYINPIIFPSYTHEHPISFCHLIWTFHLRSEKSKTSWAGPKMCTSIAWWIAVPSLRFPWRVVDGGCWRTWGDSTPWLLVTGKLCVYIILGKYIHIFRHTLFENIWEVACTCTDDPQLACINEALSPKPFEIRSFLTVARLWPYRNIMKHQGNW